MALPPFQAKGLGFLMIPVLVLPALALNQARLHADSALSSWRGGGFGMFASVDRDYHRSVQITVSQTDGSVLLIDWPSIEKNMFQKIDAQEAFTDARAFPTADRLEALAQLLASRTWQVSGDRAELLVQGTGANFAPNAFSIKVYGITYDKNMNRVTPQLLASWPGDSK